MMTLNHGARQYQQTQVLTTSGVQLIVLLYDSAIQSLELAREGMQNNNSQDKARFLGRAVAIVTELSNVLDFEKGGDVAKSLYRLYDYMLAELLRANLRNNSRHLEGPLKCLMTLREGWQTIARQDASVAATVK
ncbi:MAG TPA: flagellar export chaperone FliS [Nitrospira sp.]|nr:flagellar export chaperone FliS [Nitrospira sp.]